MRRTWRRGLLQASFLFAASFALAACGASSQALLASGGHSDFVMMSQISDRYGLGDPDAVIPITVGEQPYSFRVWISKDGRRIMAQTDSMTGAAAAGFVRGLTMGAVRGDQDYEPYKQAAAEFLARTRGPGCTLQLFQRITHIGFEWDFTCPASGRRP